VRIAYLATGAGGMYCGTCLRDNALANAFVEMGEDVVLVPLYTPLRVDEATISGEHVFLNGVEAYLHEKFAWLRRPPGILRRILGSGWLLRAVSRFALSTSPSDLGRLTVAMLEGEAGSQHRLLTELIDWITREVSPDVVHLSSSLLSGCAREIKRRLRLPVISGLQGEALFLEGLPEPFRSRALSLLRERSADIDRYTASSAYEADLMARWVGIDRAKIHVVRPGIRVEDFDSRPPELPGGASGPGRPLSIGYFARIAPEKGFHILAEAFGRIASSGEFPGLRLKAAGYLGSRDLKYAAHVRRSLARKGLGGQVEIWGTVERADKLQFFREIDVFSVPTAFAEPKGIFILEALASGVPVVEPRHGSFPELIEASGGGLLYEPGDIDGLARALSRLLGDAELRRSLGECGRKAAQTGFTRRRMAEDVLAVYRQVLADRLV